MSGGEENKENTKTEINANDPNSPYFLSSSEQPSYIISPVKLRGQNYGNWSRLVVNALKAKNKFGFVNGKIAKPDGESPEAEAWEKCNSMVTAWLYNVIDPSLYGSISFATTARDIWIDLEERYSPGNAIRIHQIKTEIRLLGQGNLSITEYFTKLKELWDELNTYQIIPNCTCGAAKEFNRILEEEKTHKFLMGLDTSKYENVRSNILQLEPLPNLNKVFAAAVRDESQRKIANNTSGSVVMEAAALKSNVLEKFRSGNRVKCSHCYKLGHEKSQCFELVGYPTNWGNRKGSREFLLTSRNQVGENFGNKGRSWSSNEGRKGIKLEENVVVHHVHGRNEIKEEDGKAKERESDWGRINVTEKNSLYGLSTEQVENLFNLFKEKEKSEKFSGPSIEEADWNG